MHLMEVVDRGGVAGRSWGDQGEIAGQDVTVRRECRLRVPS